MSFDTSCFNWIKMIHKDERLTASANHIAHYLATFMNLNSDIAWPSLQRIAAETRLHKSTIARHLQVLEQHGWIVREKGNSKTNTRYLAVFPNDRLEALVGSRTLRQRSRTERLEVVADSDPNNNSNNNLITKGEKTVAKAPPAKRATAVDPDFKITEEMINWAETNNLGHMDLDYETSNFVDYFLGTGATKKDWFATWRNWIKKANQYNKGKAQKDQPKRMAYL